MAATTKTRHDHNAERKVNVDILGSEGRFPNVIPERKFRTISEAQSYIDGLTGSPRFNAWRDRMATNTILGPAPSGPPKRIRVLDKRSFRSVTKQFGLGPIPAMAAVTFVRQYLGCAFVYLPRWALCETVILHEVAHCVAGQEVGHQPAFVAAWLELVGVEIGWSAAGSLYAAICQRASGLTPHTASKSDTP